MSTVAAARVETRIVLQGEGNAARAVRDTRDGLDDLGDSAEEATEKSGKTLKDWTEQINEKMEKIAGAIGAFDGMLEESGGPMKQIGAGLGAAKAIADTLPGPMGTFAGLAVTAATQIYKIAKAASEASAKARYLADYTKADSLAKGLGVSMESATELQYALNDLSEDGLQPSAMALKEIRDRAEEMGQDGGKAAADFVKAWQQGPQAFKDLQKSIGDLGIDAKTLGKKVGFSELTLGLAKDENDAQVKQAAILKEQAGLQAQINLLAQKRISIWSEDVPNRVADRIYHEQKLKAVEAEFDKLKEQETALKAQVPALEAMLAARARFASASAAQAETTAATQSRIALLEFDATEEKRHQVSVGLQLQVVEEQIADIKQRQKILAENAAGFSAEQLETQQNALLMEQKQAEKRQADIIADKAYRDERAAKAKERAAAEFAAEMKLAQAQSARLEAASQDPAIDPAVIKRKLEIIDLERKAALRDAKERSNTAKGRKAEILAIEQETANKREAIAKAARDRAIAIEEEQRDAASEARQRELDALSGYNEQISGLAAERQASIAEGLRARGKFTDATLVDIRQAEADHAAQIIKIERDLQKALKDATIGGDEERAARTLADAQKAAATRELATKTATAYEAQSQALAGAIDAQTGSISSIVDAAAGAAGIDDIAGSVTNLSGSLRKGMLAWKDYGAAQANGNADQLTKATNNLSTALDSTITASGAAAAAFVDDEKTKAGILALTETAASIAAFATGNVAGGIGHAASAAIYAGIAGGAIPSGGAGGAGPTETTGATTGGGTVAGTAGQGGAAGAGTTTVINFNKGFIFGTQQEVAKGINGTLRSIGGTGYDKRKAV